MPTFPTDIPFQQVITALLDPDKLFNPHYLQHFSDLDKNELALLRQVWQDVPAWRRKALLEDIEQLGEQDTRLSFEVMARFALLDDDPDVRLPALRALWEYDTVDLIPTFIDLLRNNPSTPVRAAAASILGRFLYRGELEEISETRHREIETSLLTTLQSQDDDQVRRRALESLGYSSQEEIPPLIETAFHSGDKAWIASALYAMGRSADPRWEADVLPMLDSLHPIIRAEAARAAGELELTAAVRSLIGLLDDPDSETREASIWSLSQLGGDGVQKRLQRLLMNASDAEERIFIESALDNLIFNEELGLLPIFDFSETEGEAGEDLDDDDEVGDFDEEFGEEFADEFGDDLRLDPEDDDDELLGGKAGWYEEEDDVEDLD